MPNYVNHKNPHLKEFKNVYKPVDNVDNLCKTL